MPPKVDAGGGQSPPRPIHAGRWWPHERTTCRTLQLARWACDLQATVTERVEFEVDAAFGYWAGIGHGRRLINFTYSVRGSMKSCLTRRFGTARR